MIKLLNFFQEMRRYILGYYLSILLITIITADNFCSDRASFDKVDEWLQWKAKAVALDFTTGYTKLAADIVILVNAIAGVRSAIKIIESANPTIETPGLSHITARGTYFKLTGKASEAETKCTNAGGSLPLVENVDDDTYLYDLAVRYGVKHLFIKGLPEEKNGMYSKSHYLVSEWDEDKFKKDSKDYGPIIGEIDETKNEIVLGTSPEASTQVDVEFLCLYDTPMFNRSKTEKEDTKAVAEELLEVLTEYQKSLLQIKSLIIGGDDSSQVTLPEISGNATKFVVGTIPTGLKGIKSFLLRITSVSWWYNSRLDLINELEFNKNLIRNVWSKNHFGNHINVPLNSELKRHIVKRGVVSLLAQPVINWARVKLLTAFRDFVVGGILEYISDNIKSKLYQIRPFLNSDSKILKDDWLLERGTASYSSQSRPMPVGCERIKGRKVCSGEVMDQEGGRDFGCALGLLGKDTTEECQLKNAPDNVWIYPEVQCRAANSKEEKMWSGVNDVINAKFKGKVKRNCGYDGTTILPFNKGTNAINILSGQKCTYIYGDTVLYARNDPQTFRPKNSVIQQGTTDTDEKIIRTVFGNFTKTQLTITMVSMISTIVSIISIVVVICCPVARHVFMDNCLCCFKPKGCTHWKRHGILPRCCRFIRDEKGHAQYSDEYEKVQVCSTNEGGRPSAPPSTALMPQITYEKSRKN